MEKPYHSGKKNSGVWVSIDIEKLVSLYFPEDLPPNLDPFNSPLFYYTAPPSGTRRILRGDSYSGELAHPSILPHTDTVSIYHLPSLIESAK